MREQDLYAVKQARKLLEAAYPADKIVWVHWNIFLGDLFLVDGARVWVKDGEIFEEPEPQRSFAT